MLYAWHMAAVRQIGFAKKTYLDHSTLWESPLPTYGNISNKFCENILIGVREWRRNFTSGFNFDNITVILRYLPVYHRTKENLSAHGWVVAIQLFSLHSFKLTLPTAQRHVMQATRSASLLVGSVTLWSVPLKYWGVTAWSVGGKRRRLSRRVLSRR